MLRTIILARSKTRFIPVRLSKAAVCCSSAPRHPFLRQPSGPSSRDSPSSRHSSSSHAPSSSQTRASSASASRKRLVILGTGWASYSVLTNIKKSLYDVLVISPRNHFLFTPLLASTTVGTLEFRSITEPIRNTIFRQPSHFHLASAIGLDAVRKRVQCRSDMQPSNVYEVDYDALLIGVGAVNNTFGVPGVEQHACFLKEIDDARKIRMKLLSNFELASQPYIDAEEARRLMHTVVVGGGPTGVEFGAELYDFVEQDVARLYGNQNQMARVTLVESKQILSSFDARLQAFAERKLRARDRFELVQSSVVDVGPTSVTLKDGRRLPCGLVVWSTGLAPRPFVRDLAVKKNGRGQIMTDHRLEVKDHENVYALGDCAEIEDDPLPCTAQVAERQGRYLADQLNRQAEGRKTVGFRFKSAGMLAYIGGYQALTDLPDVKLKGFPSWLLWRSAYATRLGSWRLRLQVPIDWMKTFFWGRDTSRF